MYAADMQACNALLAGMHSLHSLPLFGHVTLAPVINGEA